MFKQTAAAFAFVPGLAMLAQFEKFSFQERRFLFPMIPIGSVLVLVIGTWYLAPGLWHFMVEIPGQYRISILRMARMGVELLTSFPLFVLAMMHWAFADAQDSWQLPRARWLMAALICAIPSSLAAFAKDGGGANCLIPAILAISAFCAWRVPVPLVLLRDNRRPLALRVATGMLLGILLFAHAYPAPEQLGRKALKGGHGTTDRSSVVAEVSLLPGKVISPDDPTIALIAKGYAGRTAVFESDAVYWAPSQALVREVDSADFLVAMRHTSGWTPQIAGKSLVATNIIGCGTNDPNDVLQAKGFAKTAFQSTFSPVYELWRRTRLPDPALPTPCARDAPQP
jgi:hypothetical protein